MNQEIITRYIGQPARLPSELRARIEREWRGRPVQLYALSDLDQALQLSESWIALGPSHVTFARALPSGEWELTSIERSRIQAVRESPGLSANTLSILGAP